MGQNNQPTMKSESESPKTEDISHTLIKQSKTERIPHALIQSAEREGDVFLIDFSKITPSNIFNIFSKGRRGDVKYYGDVVIDDKIFYDESEKFNSYFPFKFQISVVTNEKNKYGYATSDGCMFTMNEKGEVESYGRLFDNFDQYLEHIMKARFYLVELSKFASFEYLDFHSVCGKTLRKKATTK